MRRFFVLAVVLAVVGCDEGSREQLGQQKAISHDAAAEATRAEKDDSWTAHMQQKVRESLKDPGSATFRNSRTYHGGGVPVVCGEVNSKNSFGGMGGYQRFVAAGEIIALDEQVDGGIREVWDQFCRD